MTYHKSLDSIRALAVIVVIIGHWFVPFEAAFQPDIKFWISGLIPQAGFGVHLFFVLSGFLITTILLNARQNSDKSKLQTIKAFIIRRVLRIFPIYYLSILILLIAGFEFAEGTLSYIALYISNIKIYQLMDFYKWSHTWSLAVEEQFYLIWPWVILFIPKRRLKITFLLCIAIGLASTYYTMVVLANWAGIFLVTSCIQAFAIGGFYAHLRLENKLEQYKSFFSFAFVVSLIVFYQFSFHQHYKEANDYLILLIDSVVSIGLIHLALNNKSEAWRKYFFEQPFINKIGKISYGIYLYHQAMGFLWESIILLFTDANSKAGIFLLDWENAYYFKLVLLYFISLWSYKYIEMPFLRLKSKFNY